MQHKGTEQITNTILFQHHIPLPAVSVPDCLLTAIKQLQDAEEKEIDTHCPMNKSILPETMDHPLNSNTALSTPNMVPPVLP